MDVLFAPAVPLVPQFQSPVSVACTGEDVEEEEVKRRMHHNLAEQRRRDRISDVLHELKDMLPAYKNGPRGRQINKANVLLQAIEYIKSLEKSLETFKTEVAELKEKNESLEEKLKDSLEATPSPAESATNRILNSDYESNSPDGLSSDGIRRSSSSDFFDDSFGIPFLSDVDVGQSSSSDTDGGLTEPGMSSPHFLDDHLGLNDQEMDNPSNFTKQVNPPLLGTSFVPPERSTYPEIRISDGGSRKRRMVMDASRVFLFSVVFLSVFLPHRAAPLQNAVSSGATRVLNSSPGAIQRHTSNVVWWWSTAWMVFVWLSKQLFVAVCFVLFVFVVMVTREVNPSVRSETYRAAQQERKKGQSAFNRGQYSAAKVHFESCLSLFSRDPASGPVVFVLQYAWVLLRQFLHLLRVGRFLDRSYVYLFDARASYLEAAAAYHGLFRICCKDLQAQRIRDRFMRWFYALYALNLAESIGPNPELSEIYASVSLYLQLYRSFLSWLSEFFIGRAWTSAGSSDRNTTVDRTLVWLFFLSGQKSLVSGEWKQSVRTLRRAAQIFEEQKRYRRMFHCLEEMGLVFMLRGSVCEAEKVFDRVRGLAVEKGHKDSECRSLLSLAACVAWKLNMRRDSAVPKKEDVNDSGVRRRANSDGTDDSDSDPSVLNENLEKIDSLLSEALVLIEQAKQREFSLDRILYESLRAVHNLHKGAFDKALECAEKCVESLSKRATPHYAILLVVHANLTEVLLCLWNDMVKSKSSQSESKLAQNRSVVEKSNLKNIEKKVIELATAHLCLFHQFERKTPVAKPYYLFYRSIYEMMVMTVYDADVTKVPIQKFPYLKSRERLAHTAVQNMKRCHARSEGLQITVLMRKAGIVLNHMMLQRTSLAPEDVLMREEWARFLFHWSSLDLT